MSDILCIYCSRSGITKSIMESAAAKLGAELCEITDGKSRRGAFGFWGAALSALGKKLPALLPVSTEKPLEDYRTVIVGMPIWSETTCPIAKSFLKNNSASIKGDVYYIVTHMSKVPYDKPISKLSGYLGKPCKGYVSVKTKNHDYRDEIDRFIEKLK